jgi:hypothetical protein
LLDLQQVSGPNFLFLELCASILAEVGAVWHDVCSPHMSLFSVLPTNFLFNQLNFGGEENWSSSNFLLAHIVNFPSQLTSSLCPYHLSLLGSYPRLIHYCFDYKQFCSIQRIQYSIVLPIN